MKEKLEWWKEAVVYQIYPKSFCDSNGDGIGDLQGVISKLDYLQDLGVDVLWLSPFYNSPGHDNGYDISDYDGVDPQFGTLEDVKQLLHEAHSREMRVIFDLVVNHSSDQHSWFQDDAVRKNYYIWRDGCGEKGELPPNNWGALFGGPAWTKVDSQYYLHLFSPYQPDLNWENENLRQDIYAMMRRWLDIGVDGFRMDVISLIAKPEDFGDGPVGKNGYFDPRSLIANTPKVHQHLKEMRREALNGFDVMTVGEASGVTLEEAIRYTNPDNKELDMVFQFEHMDLDGGETFKWSEQSIQLKDFKIVMDKWQLGMEGKGWNGLFLNNHDQPRMVSRMGDGGNLRETSAKMLATFLLTLKGTPFIYQGEELGMTNMKFTSPDQLRDPESMNAFKQYTNDNTFTPEQMLHYISLKSRDNARTPMQWSDCFGAGFTTAQPWMVINPNYKDINAKEQSDRKDSVLSHYRKLIKLRREYKVMIYGIYEPFAAENEHVYAYTRSLKNQTLFVCCNFSQEPIPFSPPEKFNKEKGQLLLSNIHNSNYQTSNILSPFEAVILLFEEE